MLTLKCQIEIRSKSTKKTVRFDYANSIEVKTSSNSLTDTAVLKLPRKMSWRGKPLTDYVRRNDDITIRAGYAEHGLETLFQGYVKDVENGRPVEITCEKRDAPLEGDHRGTGDHPPFRHPRLHAPLRPGHPGGRTRQDKLRF